MNDKERILGKIKKCMALGRSANEHEAAAAMRQARKLMEKHGLTESHVGLAEFGEKGVKVGYRRFPNWLLSLSTVVGMAFQCSSYTSWKSVDFVGRQENSVVAGYCLEVLLRQIRKARKEYLASLPKTGRSAAHLKRCLGDAYCEGWVAAVARKVEEFASPLTEQEESQHNKYLAEVKGCQVNESRKGQRKSAAESSDIAMTAAAMGYRAGKDVQLHHGMNSEQKETLALESGALS